MRALLLSTALALGAAAAPAQPEPAGPGLRSGTLAGTMAPGDEAPEPGPRRGHLGLTLGDDRVHLYAGGFFSAALGAEVGYQREDGRRAEGLNLSLVLRSPPTARGWHVFGKLGGLHGRTRSAAGRETGWGPHLAAGIGLELTPRSSVVVEWSLGRYRFAGGRREDVEGLGIGAVHRF